MIPACQLAAAAWIGGLQNVDRPGERVRSNGKQACGERSMAEVGREMKRRPTIRRRDVQVIRRRFKSGVKRIEIAALSSFPNCHLCGLEKLGRAS